ncbi:SDR family NAD(P)-dependent oxidoreductase, partial [Bacteroides thetaiotaomicron]
MKRAIIIGATSGIGKEVAQRLLSEGWQIGIAGRRQSALEDFR